MSGGNRSGMIRVWDRLVVSSRKRSGMIDMWYRLVWIEAVEVCFLGRR